MTLFKIAYHSMSRNLSQYLIYFISVVVSVVIFFTFMTLANYPLIDQIFKKWELYGSALFFAAALLLALFVVFFIFYSNSYFIKRRKREIGMYSLLGLRKIQISLLLFFENILLYLLALISGILAGIFFSKLFTMLLFWVVDLHVNTRIVISGKAILATAMVFLGIMLLVSLYNLIFIFRSSLISLFQKEVAEKKNPRGSLILSIVGLGLIGFGYYLACQPIVGGFWSKLGGSETMILILSCVILGTWVVIRYGVPAIIRFCYLNDPTYYRGVNMLVLSSLRYRIKHNANTLAMIAILSAATMTIIAGMSSLYYPVLDKVRKDNPVSYQFLNLSDVKEKKVDDALRSSTDHNLLYKTHSEYIKLGLEDDNVRVPSGYWTNHANFSVISMNEFNRLNDIEGGMNAKIKSIADHEAVLISQYEHQAEEDGKVDYQKIPYTLVDKNNQPLFTFKITDFRDYSLYNDNYGLAAIVVNNKTYEMLKKTQQPERITSYDVTNEDRAEDLTYTLQAIVDGKPNFWSENISSYYANYHMFSIYMGTFLYIGTFIGIIFFMATGSIIYFKQITEAVEERDKFQTLLKLGLTKRELKITVARQLIPMFAIPLILGLSHSLMAMVDLSINFEYEIKTPVLVVFTVYCLLYGIYYWLCIHNYTKIVLRNRP
ncbi:ABC transporter permease [Listeria costaricensis]|uniref:ABC transporter permease n=1 Tax=Listeria costaricensis TaxID=2026604 RepID=UPI000C0736AE|nr:ABC transporter permease [Listeria costaricensis]